MSTNQLNLIMGAGIDRKEDREENDFYATDPKALELLLDQLWKDGIMLSKNVWEPACGSGNLSKVLEQRGYSAFNTDLINRGYENQHLAKSFFEFDKEWDGDILTNPPYKLAVEFINHSLKLVKEGCYVIMFLKVQFLESQKRYDSLFKNNPPKYVYVFSNRVDTAMNGEFEKYKKCAPSTCYAWFIWEKGYKGEPVIRWLHK
jgi:hypothetical protein